MNPGYDPDEPDDRPSQSSYLSKKDFKILAIVLVIFGLISIPIFNFLRRQAEQATCSTNFRAIYSAIGVYSALNDDQLPPTFATSATGGDAYVDSRGRPYTWVSLIQPQLSTRASFKCPAATEPEFVINQSGTVGGDSPISTYGMYSGVSAARLTTMGQPGQTVMIGETASLGSRNTFDPLPMKDGAGKPIRDGFMIGFDNDSHSHDKQTRFVTRLAYENTGNGSFLESSLGRHPNGNHFLFCDGHLETLKAPVARVRHLGVDLLSPWATR